MMNSSESHDRLRRARELSSFGLSALATRVAPPPLPTQPPDPAHYSTTDSPMEVPVQREAYFIALNEFVRDGDAVLDVGCGLGYGLNLLAIKAAEVVGVDVDEQAIAYCRERLQGRNPRLTALDVYDGETLPYPDDRFDIVTTIDVIEHVPDYQRFLAELVRVARRAVIVSTPNRRPEHTNTDGTPMNHWHLREWTRSELETILQPLGIPVAWFHVNGDWGGPHTVTREVTPDTQTLTPVLVVGGSRLGRTSAAEPAA
jgi:SAM-dependent methyltransferase